MQQPKLEQPLIDKLVAFTNHSQGGLRSAATKVLNNYKLDMEGNPARSPGTIRRSAATSINSQEQGHPKLYPATDVEPAHSSGEVNGVKREIWMC